MRFRRIPKEVNIIPHDPLEYINPAIDFCGNIVDKLLFVIGIPICILMVIITVPILFLKELICGLMHTLDYMTYNTTPEFDAKVQEIITRKRGDSK